MDVKHLSTEQLIDILPPNRPLTKELGLWGIRGENNELILLQRLNETLRSFIIRYMAHLLNNESHEEFETELRKLSYAG